MSSLVLSLRKDRRLFPRPLPFRLQNRRNRRVGLCANRLHAFLNLVYCRKTCSNRDSIVPCGIDSWFMCPGMCIGAASLIRGSCCDGC